MIFTLPVRIEEQERLNLGAVTHIDGSARVQSVSRETNPRFHELISAFAWLTDVPILLNTSFNYNCEPIVETVTTPVACFLTTGIDRLVVGDFLVEKSDALLSGSAYLALTAEVPPIYRLTRQIARSGEPEFALEFVGSGCWPAKPHQYPRWRLAYLPIQTLRPLSAIAAMSWAYCQRMSLPQRIPNFLLYGPSELCGSGPSLGNLAENGSFSNCMPKEIPGRRRQLASPFP